VPCHEVFHVSIFGGSGATDVPKAHGVRVARAGGVVTRTPIIAPAAFVAFDAGAARWKDGRTRRIGTRAGSAIYSGLGCEFPVVL
jgi:hypothetical protein